MKAIDIGDRLMPAIEKSKSAVPFSDVDLRSHQAQVPSWGSSSSTSEGSFQFRIFFTEGYRVKPFDNKRFFGGDSKVFKQFCYAALF